MLRPVRFELGRPRIVSDILDSYHSSIDGWIVPKGVEQLRPPQVQDYVEDVLLSPDRNLPVIIVSPDARSGCYAVRVQDLFERLKGYAHVTVLSDKFAAFKLTDAVEKPLSCYDGAVRVYWPGFTLDANPFQHKLFLAQSIRYHEEQGLPLANYLFRTLAAVASFRYAEGNVIRAARQALTDLEKQKVDDLRQQMKLGAVEKERLEQELLEALDRNDELQRERDRLKSDLDAQRAAWAEVQQTMAAGDADVGETLTKEKVRFKTVAEAVTQAKKDFSKSLVFLESAIESAKDSPYKDPDRVYELFEALALVADEWKEKKGRLGRSWGDALSDLGFDYAERVSQTSKGKWSDDYKFLYKGKKRLFEKHITIGAKQADKCLSVHWYRDVDDHVLVIGHCGRHLTNTSS